jgi:enoyl-CoA hydratase/carnithine racemase
MDLTIEDSVALIRLNRPDQLNAINRELRGEVYQAIQQIEHNDSIRVTVLTGAGQRAFCAGADLKEMAAGGRNRTSAPGGFAGFVRHERTKPVIAAVNGLAFGGGFEIVLACDLVVAASHAEFALPEVRRGIIAGGGGALRLSRVLPPVVARELLLTGASLPAADALRWGLVNRVVDGERVLDTARELAKEIVRAAPVAVAATLAVARVVDRQIEGVGWLASDQALERVRLTDDAKEGPSAFSEGRSPTWTGV